MPETAAKQTPGTLGPMDVPPLRGFVVGVTADRRSAEQIDLLARWGASVLHAPMVRTHPFAGDRQTADAIAALVADPPDVTVLTTGIGVRSWLDAADALGRTEALVDALGRSTVVARGPKAHGAAVTAGLSVAWQPAGATGAEVVAELHRRGVRGRRVAVQLDGDVGAPLAAAVAALGADVVAVPVYRWTVPDNAAAGERLVEAVVERRVDAVTFTARPQVDHLSALATRAGSAAALRDAFTGDVRAVCVGPVCAAAAVAAGFGDPAVPGRHRLGAMVRALADALRSRVVETSLGGAPLRIQGRLVVVGEAIVPVTDREAAVLRALAARPGAVVSKAQLLEQVWSGARADAHVVEVTVARLRGRLGPVGRSVQTVIRRGYRLAP